MNFFSSDTVFSGQFEAIDAEQGVIKGVKMCSEGEAKGHGVWLNKKFISKVVELAQEQERGVKARFGHPNMCSDALGTYIGVYKNVRRKIERREKGEETRHHAIGDLFLSKSSQESPNGNLYNYILGLAKESPDMFGSSIVFSGETLKETYESEGEVYQLQDIDKLFATDLVDSPAATDGLFSVNENDLASKVTEFLDTNPKVFELVSKKPEIIEGFMNKYNNYKAKNEQKNENMDKTFFDELKGMLNDIKEALSFKKDETKKEPEVENKVDLSAIENKINEVEIENSALTAKVEAFDAEKIELSNKITSLEAEIERLNAIESEYNKLSAKGTKVDGVIGEENIGEVVLSQEQKDLLALKDKLIKAQVCAKPVEHGTK